MGKSRTLIIVLCLILLSAVAFAEKSYQIWTTFSSGELSPLIDGQVNFDKYFTGVKKLENFLARPQGPVSNRPGFKYIAGTKTDSSKSRVVPFVFSDTQAYVLEFGDQYVRFFRDGGQITSIDAETVLLLSMNGIDASTTFTDSSATPHAMTAVSPAQVDTAQKKFSTGSGLFDGSTSGITTPDHADFDISAADGGIDVWVRPTVGNSGIYTIFRQDQNADSEVYMRAYLDKYTGVLLNGNGSNESTTISDSSLNTKTLTSAISSDIKLLMHMDEADGGTDFTDSSASAHVTTAISTAQIDTAQKKFGTSSGLFNGSTDYVTVAHSADFDFSGGIWTVDFWVKLNSVDPGVNQSLFHQSTDFQNLIRMQTDANSLYLLVRTGGASKVIRTTGSVLSANTWHHIAFVENGSSYQIFVDGVDETQSNPTDPDRALDYTGDVYIGYDPQAVDYFLDGWIDEFRVTKGVALWTADFDEPVKATGVQIDTSDPKFGTGAIEFGGQDYLTHTGDSDFDIGATGSAEVFTIEMWVNPDVTSGSPSLFNFFQDSDNYLDIYLSGATVFARHRADAGTPLIISGAGLVAGTYSHIAVVGDGTNFSLYIDGTRVDTDTFSDTLNDMSSDDMYIGSSNSGASRYTGSIDDFKFTVNERYSGATLTVPTVEDKYIAHATWEIGETTPTTQTAEATDDNITAESFHHIEFNWDTSDNKLYLFTDGQLRTGGAVTFTGATADPSGALDSVFSIGTDPDGSTLPYKGWMDELRFTNGTLRHTADFVPPISEYTLLGSTPLEITTNVDYVEADIFALQFSQSADTLYITHPDYTTRKLLRITDTTWRMVDVEFLPPPLIADSIDASLALTLGQKTVGVGVNATDGATAGTMFAAGDVGKEIREDNSVGDGRAIIVAVASADAATVDIFVEFSSTTVASGTWDKIGTNSSGTITISGNINAATFAVELGEVVTLTSSLAVFAGGATDVGKFVTTNDGTGSAIYKVVTNTGSSTTVVQAAAMNSTTYTTNQVMLAGEWELKKSAWAANDYPSAVTFFENRLLLAGSASFPSTIWGSAVDDYENNNLGNADDADAYSFTLAGRQVNKIQWLDSSDVLLVGTSGAEWVLGTKGSSAPTTPSNVLARLQTGYGSESIQSVNIGQSVLYLQKGGEKVREMTFDFDTDKHESPDLSILAEHITEGGIIEMDYQDNPISTGWFVRSDGVLLSMTLLRDQNVIGWARHITDGTFESIAVIPGEDGDELWAIVNRTISGGTVRYVEKMNPIYDDTTLDSDQAFFVDSGLLYTGVETSTITGLDHLEGETVSVLGDGLVQADKTVSSGSITLTTAASRVAAGLPYTSTLQTMRIETKDGKGTAQGRDKRHNRVTFRVDNTKQFQYGQTPTGTLKTHTFTSLFSGDKEVDFIPGNTTEGYVTVVNSEPLPISILAIIPEMNLSD